MCCRYYFDNDTMEDIRRLTGAARSLRQTIPDTTSEAIPDTISEAIPDTTSEAIPDTISRKSPRPSEKYPPDIYSGDIHPGDIHPEDMAIVLTGKTDSRFALQALPMRWGFLSKDRKLLINARAETALQKKIFAESTLRRRCIIPAAGFYEWDADKNKAVFTGKDSRTIYMAGIYDLCDNEPRFTILTTEANTSMAPVHDRMPLILQEDDIRSWISEPENTASYLQFQPEELNCSREYEQLSLF